MKKDYCPGINLPIIQRDGMFHFNTDSTLLGQFLRVNTKETLLDVGTNNGVILLYASVSKPKWLYGIDILEDAIRCAEENMVLNHIDHVSLAVCDVSEFKTKVNVIVCNPPYFKEDFRSQETNIRSARHQETLNLETLYQHAARLLEDKGRLYFVYPADQIENVVHYAKVHRFALKKLKFAYKKSKQRAHVVLVECHKNGKQGCVIESPVVVG